jgi:uncharacterized protein
MLLTVKHIVVLLALVLGSGAIHAQWLPEKSNRLVNDYSGILSEQQCSTLEQRLVAFNDSTSNQILVVITPTLGGDDENAVAQRIGQAWAVGQEEFNNGVVILIKSKTEEEDWGAVAISTGYGVEGALPDLFCKRIIDDRMLSSLGDGDYYDALTAALDVIEPVLAGEYNYNQYRKDERRKGMIALGILVLFFATVFVLLLIHAKRHPDQWKGGSSGMGGSGFFYGGGSSRGGGFGGFGGGSFGGGGASGRF